MRLGLSMSEVVCTSDLRVRGRVHRGVATELDELADKHSRQPAPTGQTCPSRKRSLEAQPVRPPGVYPCVTRFACATPSSAHTNRVAVQTCIPLLESCLYLADNLTRASSREDETLLVLDPPRQQERSIL